MSEKREKVKLTDKQFELLRPRYQVGEQNVIGMLLDHIDVVEAEFDSLVESSDNLFDEQATRIKQLEHFVAEVREIAYMPVNNRQLSTNWATDRIGKALEKLAGKANG